MIMLFPGTVTAYVPYRILAPVDVPDLVSWTLRQYAATSLLTFGVAVLLMSIWSFAIAGRGTLAPFDETKKLVVVGLYRYVRNPMYVAVMLILLAECWFFWSCNLLMYTGFCFVAANLIVVGYEENRLKHKYGGEYRQYCARVGRWIPRIPHESAG
jgi:protein-S-isoprenylcysteine O-methyltransferase Ste14